MAVNKRRYMYYNGTGYDEEHFVTDANITYMNDGTTVEDKLKMYTTTNSSNAYSVTIPNLASLTDGLNIRVKFNVASTGAITLNINSLGAKSVKDFFGNSVTNVRANLPANLTYESSSDSFILLGKGGGGNAVATDLLSGKTATTDNGQITGNMPNNPAQVNAVSVGSSGTNKYFRIPTGAYLTKASQGYPEIIATASQIDSNIVAENIKENISICGIKGTLKQFAFGMTDIVDSSHTKTNAPIDLASIRLELYSRPFPNDFSKIQIIKNNSANVFGGANIKTDPTGNATDEESIYLTLNENMYPDTDYKVILTKGSIKDKLNNDFNELEYSFHTNPNPSVWVNNPNGLLTGRQQHAGCGEQSSSLAFGGRDKTNNYSENTEKFNGSTWSTTGDLITARDGLAGCGNQSAALTFGGYFNAYLANTEKFNGSTWSTTGNLITARNRLAGCGEQNSALSFGGNFGSTVKNTEKFDGSTWSTTGNLITARNFLAGCGSQSAALSFGGDSTGVAITNTEKFNGSTWSTANNMITASRCLAGCGEQNSALVFGGNNPGILSSTEKFNGSTWSTTGNLITARDGLAGCGSQSAALSFGGNFGSTVKNTEKFFG